MSNLPLTPISCSSELCALFGMERARAGLRPPTGSIIVQDQHKVLWIWRNQVSGLGMAPVRSPGHSSGF